MRHERRGTITVKAAIGQNVSNALLSPGMLLEADNVVADEIGALTKRGGYAVSGTGGASAVVRGLYTYYANNGVRYRIKACSGKLYVLTAGVWSEIGTGFTESNFWTFATIGNRCVMTNGADNPQTYDGTTLRALGYPTPTAPVATYNAGGGDIAAGLYYYRVSFVYETGESNASVRSNHVNVLALNGRVVLTDIDVDPLGLATGRRIYRTTADGEVEQLIHTIEDNTTVTWTDDINDTEIENIDYAAFNDAPLHAQFVVWWDDRPWWIRTVAHPEYVYYGETYEPNVLDPRDYFRARGPVTGVAVFYDQLLLLHAFGADAISKTSDGGYRMDSKWEGAGCNAMRSVVADGALGVAWSGPDGFYLYSGAAPRLISKPLVDTLADFSATGTDSIAGVYHQEKIIWSYTGETSSRNDRCVVYDVANSRLMNLDSWTTFSNIPANLWLVLDGPGDNDELWFGDSTTGGQAYEMFSGTTDNGSAIHTRITTKHFNFRDPFVEAIFQRWKMMYAVREDENAIVGFNLDDGRMTFSQVVPLEPVGTTGGKFVFRDPDTGETWEYPNLVYFSSAPLVGLPVVPEYATQLSQNTAGRYLPRGAIGRTLSLTITESGENEYVFYGLIVPDVLLRRL